MEMFGNMIFPDYPENDGMILVFGGADIEAHRRTLLRMNITSCKFSFFGFTQRKEPISRVIEDLSKFEYVIVEPGMGAVRSAIKKHGESFDVDHFIDKYYAFCHSVSDVANVFLAYDYVTDFFGWDAIEDRVYDGMEQGLHIAPSVYAFQTENILEKSEYLDYFDMVNFISNDKNWTSGVALADHIHSRGIKIHGHSISSMDRLQYLPLYSASTTAWLNGQKFGTTFDYSNGTIKTYNVRDKEMIRPAMMLKAEEAGLDPQLLIEEDPDELNAFNLLAWKQFADYKRREHHARTGK